MSETMDEQSRFREGVLSRDMPCLNPELLALRSLIDHLAEDVELVDDAA